MSLLLLCNTRIRRTLVQQPHHMGCVWCGLTILSSLSLVRGPHLRVLSLKTLKLGGRCPSREPDFVWRGLKCDPATTLTRLPIVSRVEGRHTMMKTYSAKAA